MKSLDHMTIGQLAKQCGVSADTLRFYEDERILLPTEKSPAGYRLYGGDAILRLTFIRQAQQCGLTLAEIRQLLEFRAGGCACCGDVRALAAEKKRQLDEKVRTMQAMSRTLARLIDICTDSDRPVQDCPILSALEHPANQQEEETMG